MPDTVTKTTDVLLRPEFAPKVLDGRKTNTRRTDKLFENEVGEPALAVCQCKADGSWIAWWGLKPIEGWQAATDIAYPDGGGFKCRYGQPGDHLRFLTTWGMATRYDNRRPLDMSDSAKVWTAFDGPKPSWCGKSRPGRFMPLWMRKRLPVFELTGVRVEQLGEITAADVVAEGFPFSSDLDAFKATWADINGKWQPELWVWVLSFRRVESPDA